MFSQARAKKSAPAVPDASPPCRTAQGPARREAAASAGDVAGRSNIRCYHRDSSLQWRVRLAWFSPMPPVRSGVADCSASIVPALRATHEIDVFVDGTTAGSAAAGIYPAHEFLHRHRRAPYDLPVYQVGNSSLHDYIWPYLFRFPGLTVLHDPHLHHARAALLLTHKRPDDYRAEFVANHPADPVEAAELAIAGFNSHLYYMWPMSRLVVEASRVSAVHSRPIAAAMAAELAPDRIEHLRLSHGTPVNPDREREARHRVRSRYGIAPDAVTFGVFGGLTPDKRISQVLDAFAATLRDAPAARLMLAGAAAYPDELAAQLGHSRLDQHVIVTGYLDTEDDLTDAIAAVDVTLNLRWPTARETSGPWLRALAAGKPSVVIDLLQTSDLPSLDPRTWDSRGLGDPVMVAVDILDEAHSLGLAMRRLAQDAALRRSLGGSARRYWMREHAPDGMLADYERLLEAARGKPAPVPDLPQHLREEGTRLLEALLAPFGIPAPLGQTR